MSRFLFATMPIPGHVAPIAPVVRMLVERGHDVVWYGSQFFADKIERTGATFKPIRSTEDYGDSELDRRFPKRARLRGLKQITFDFEHLFVGAMEGYLADLREIAGTFHPDTLVIDPAVGAGWILSDVDDLPTAIVNVTVLGLQSRDVGPFGLGLPPTSGPLGWARNRVLYWLVDNVIFRSVNRAYRRLAAKNGWPIYPWRPTATKWLYLQPSTPSFEYPRSDLPAQVHYIGPLMPDPPPDFAPPGWWDDLLAAKRLGKKVVLVTQGTIATDPHDLIAPTLAALRYEDVFVVAAGADPTKLQHIPPNARAESFVPFGPLMEHVDAYVTNGGYGGIIIALAHGVPVVSSGTTEDKAEVGGRVAYAGVGINLKATRPAEDRLRESVRAVLDEREYRIRAEAIRDQFATHDAVKEAADLLERLATTRQAVLASVDAAAAAEGGATSVRRERLSLRRRPQ
jgi:UDP:flavonoid glycosyltransferase YjiC (YdhE family)